MIPLESLPLWLGGHFVLLGFVVAQRVYWSVVGV